MSDDRIATRASSTPVEKPASSDLSSGAEAAFTHAQLGIALLDADGRIVRANASLTTLLGIDVGSPIGHQAGVWVEDDDREKFEAALQTLRKGETARMRLTVKCRKADGGQLWVAVGMNSYDDAAGGRGIVLELQDVSDWRRSEDELNWVQTHMLQTEKMASIGQLAAGVAHEINNPLGYVYANLGTLKNYIGELLQITASFEQAGGTEATIDSLREAWRQATEKIDVEYLREDVLALVAETQQGMQRVKKIVQDLKEFSHANAQELRVEADLHAGLDSTLNIVQNEIKYKARIEKAYGELPMVECVMSQINQVFMNVLINAGHAISDNGVIRIASGVDGDHVWVDISDDGGGIEPENLKRIFDPFFTTKPVGVGTGLGLSLSYSIMQKHNGRIEVESTVGKGTRFRIRLPIEAD